MSKILITGGGGYIARNIANKLCSNGHEVLAPCHADLDMTDYTQVAKYFDKHQPEGVVHAATKGGMRNSPDLLSDYTHNILMYENLERVLTNNIPVIFYTSGADFDRRYSIDEVVESDVFSRWPIDPYGLSKNIIVRRILENNRKNYHILRIFAVFNEDELTTRFIKQSILNIIGGRPIQIHQNKYMDFVYMNDLYTVTENLLTNVHGNSKHINMSYMSKTTLVDISNMIVKHMNYLNPTTVINDSSLGLSYSGFGLNLHNLSLPLIGLETGIQQTIEKILSK